MRKIEIGCFCGKEWETEIPARHDFALECEDSQTQEMTCPDCGAKYRIWVAVDVTDFGRS